MKHRASQDWVTYRKLNHSIPAVVSWLAGLVFGFGLNVLNVIYFYYLFIPTWIFTIILYTLLACAGANTGHQFEFRPRPGLRPSVQESGAVSTIVAAAGNREIGRRR
jgi:hypothetical protein